MDVDDTFRIQLGGRRASPVRGYALVDAEDFATFGALCWSRHTHGYAQRTAFVDGKAHTVLLHRAIMGLARGDSREVDHKNGDKLDNRRSNLRIVNSRAEQQQNQRPKGASRFRGVHLHKSTNRWCARCQIKGKVNYLGYYATEEEAGAVAAAFRREHMPLSRN